MQETLETQVLSLGQEDPLEKGMATHSSILAWRIPWREKPRRIGHDESDLAHTLWDEGFSHNPTERKAAQRGWMT